MTVAVAILFGAATGGVLLPAWLRWLRALGASPRVLIASWLCSITGVLLAGGGGVLLLLLPAHGIPDGVTSALGSCWTAARHGVSPRAEELAGVAGLFAVVVISARLLAIAWRVTLRRWRSHRRRVQVLELVARKEQGSPTVLWLAHDRPMAFAMAGRPTYVVATDGLARHLSTDELGAVLEHERAHLRGRHNLALSFAVVVHSALPFVPLFRAAPEVLRELVELAADSAAVRVHGADAVRGALLRVCGHEGPDGVLAFGREAVEVRLEQLAASATACHRSAVRCAAVGVPVLPFVAALTIFFGLSALLCYWG